MTRSLLDTKRGQRLSHAHGMCQCGLNHIFSPSGINSETIVKPASISEEELLNLINKLNNDDNVDGLLVQLPLPGGFGVHIFARQ